MSKFKVGDKVRFKNIKKKHSGYNPSMKNKVLIIKRFCTCPYPRFQCENDREVEFVGHGYAAYISNLEFAFPKKVPITEIDFLDSFKRNEETYYE